MRVTDPTVLWWGRYPAASTRKRPSKVVELTLDLRHSCRQCREVDGVATKLTFGRCLVGAPVPTGAPTYARRPPQRPSESLAPTCCRSSQSSRASGRYSLFLPTLSDLTSPLAVASARVDKPTLQYADA